MHYNADIRQVPRSFLPKDFQVTDWPALEPYFKNLLERHMETVTDLEQWLKDQSERGCLLEAD